LQLNALSYQLKSTFYRGEIANEPFDEAKVNILAQNGYAKTTSVYLTKDASVVSMNGTMDPLWNVNAAIIGNKLRLEQFDTVQRMGLSLTGLMDFAMTLQGRLPRPDMDLKGYFRKVVVGDQTVDDSNFELQFKKDRIEARGEFLGKTLVTHSTWPRQPDAPFDFYIKTQQWDFARIFSMLSEPHHSNEFETALTGEVTLKSPEGGFWHANGKAEVQTLLVKHGNLSLSNAKPLIISFQNGLMRTEYFELGGEQASVKLETLSTSREQIDLRLTGHFDLNLISVLTPFLSDLRGPLDFSLTAKGSLDDPTVQGSAFLNKGYLRFKDFPHAFENIHAGFVLAKRNLHLDALTAMLGGGKISADGQMGFLSGGNYPVDVAGQFQNVALNVPDGFKSKGSGTFKVSGDHFPYLLSLVYNLTGGEVTREFAQTPSLTKQVQPSSFLPKYFDKQSFEPLLFDFDFNFNSPVVVRNTLVNANVTGHLKAEGTPKKLRLTGRAQAQKGSKIFFRDTPFDVEVGNVEYHEDAPENPLIYAQGKSRVTEVSTDNRPQTYDIDLILQGHPKDLKINLSSQPALSQQQIVSLLALGMTMDNNAISATASRSTEQQSSALTTQGSVQLGTALLQKPIGNQIKDKLGVDMQISSAYSQADQTTVPKVTFSKQWTPTFIGSASRTIDKSPVNLIKLEYKMQRNLSLVGSWQGQSSDSTSLPNLQQPQVDPTPSIFGLDLEYKIEFK
jgi:translocation and assembly module TamB